MLNPICDPDNVLDVPGMINHRKTEGVARSHQLCAILLLHKQNSLGFMPTITETS